MSQFLPFFLFTLLTPAPVLSPVSLDVHVHASNLEKPDALAEFEQLMAEGLNSKFILLSPSYLIGTDVHFTKMNLPKDLENPATLARFYNEQTSKIATRYADRIQGACGLRPFHTDATVMAVTEECLDLPNMKGLKVRMPSGALLVDPNILQNIRAILDRVENKVKFVLIHLATYEHSRRDSTSPDYPQWLQQDYAEIDKVVELMAQYPHISFIIAHNAFGPLMVQRLASQARARGIQNHWVETSHILVVKRESYRESPEALRAYDRDTVAAWRDLGIERVLFGSDRGVGGGAYLGPEEFLEEKQSVQENSFLLPGELEKILYSNGMRFWESVQ